MDSIDIPKGCGGEAQGTTNVRPGRPERGEHSGTGNQRDCRIQTVERTHAHSIGFRSGRRCHEGRWALAVGCLSRRGQAMAVPVRHLRTAGHATVHRHSRWPPRLQVVCLECHRGQDADGPRHCSSDHDRERSSEPIEPYPGSTRPWRCRCLRCGAEVTPRHGNIKQGWGGCRTCWRAASSVRQRGSEPEAVEAMRSVGLEPLDPYQNAMTPWRSQCRMCGREVSPRLNNVRSGQGGCKWCANCAVDPESAADIMRQAGLEPYVPRPGRAVPWPCRCEQCHRTVSPRYGAVRRGSGCRYCKDTAIKPDVAAALMRTVGLEPLERYPGSLRPWTCLCTQCGRTVHPCYSTIQQGWGGCRWCRDSGFKSAEPPLSI